MHPYVAASAICAALVLGAAAVSAVAPHEANDVAPAHDAPGGGHGRGHGAGAHDWSGGRGTIPSATATLDRIASIAIGNNSQFNPANGVRGGSGTFEDPYVISGWLVDTIHIHDTSAAYEIKENRISNILVLDWTGAGGYVHHNYVANLRTNRNVERTGDPSAAVIERNQIDRVEELRHFDGIVRHNVIGQAPLLGLGLANLLQPDVVLNIAGLNGAGIHDNVIHGGVDMKLHGHHHGDAHAQRGPDAAADASRATGGHSHNHGKPDATQGEDHREDHQVRHVDFVFARNTIKDAGFGLRYNDLAHAGDDRTATSEDEPALELPHVHHTRIAIEDNVIDGATMRVAVVNADDERHVAGQSAILSIERNRILRPLAGDGLVVADVADAEVLVRDNTVEKGDLQLAGRAAIHLQRFRNATVHLDGNALGPYQYGIRASAFDGNTTWSIGDNQAAGTEHAVYWDDTVANPPEEGGARPAHRHDGAEATSARRRALLPEGSFRTPL